MKYIYSLAFFILISTSTNANAWFFFFIPPLGGGSATTDNTCVAETAKEGDTFNSPSGNIAKVTKLSGSSNRCKDPSMPILATVDYASSINFTSKAGIELPEKFKPLALTDRQRFFEGILLRAKTDDGKLYVNVSSTKRSIITSMPEFAKKFREGLKNLDESTYSPVEELSINNLPAWQFEQKGKLKNLFGSRMTMLHTIIESKDEAIIVQAWGYDNDYADEKESFKKLPFSLKGLTPPVLASSSGNSAASQSISTSDVAKANTPKLAPDQATQKSAALTAAQDALAENPDKATSWEKLGAVYLDEKDYPKAVKSYEEAIKLDPTSVNALADLGRSYNALGDKDKVREVYFKLKSVDATRAAAYFKEFLLP